MHAALVRYIWGELGARYPISVLVVAIDYSYYHRACVALCMIGSREPDLTLTFLTSKITSAALQQRCFISHNVS